MLLSQNPEQILEYLEKHASTAAAAPAQEPETGAAAAQPEPEPEPETTSAAETKAPDTLETKIKKLGATEKLPEAYKDAYLSAKQKALEAEAAEIMKDETVKAIVQKLETDPNSVRGATMMNGSLSRWPPPLRWLGLTSLLSYQVMVEIEADEGLQKKLSTLVQAGVLTPPQQGPPPGMPSGGMPPGMMGGGGMPPGMMGGDGNVQRLGAKPQKGDDVQKVLDALSSTLKEATDLTNTSSVDGGRDSGSTSNVSPGVRRRGRRKPVGAEPAR